jgi:hypothetical protein
MVDHDTPPLEEPLAKLELALIEEYVRSQGYDPVALQARSDDVARAVLRNAAIHAATRLTEIESRAHYVQEIHTAPNTGTKSRR